ncbi:MAG: hypothetical protein IV100_22880 [Myxococcales bacterium]|nr:hypothetical protein [Myxococcales bacterium]
MQLTLNKALLRRKIDEHYAGRAAGLADRLGIHRSTVFRWADDGEELPLPRSADIVLELSHALDVDPLALWRWSRHDFPLLISRVLRTARTGRWPDFLPALGFLDRLLLPMDHWPPSELVNPSHRRWHTYRVRAEGPLLREDRVTVRIRPRLAPNVRVGRPEFEDPQIWYVATRPTRTPSPEWFKVGGFIVRSGPALSLYSLTGLSIDAELTGDDGFAIEATAAEGTEISIASVHRYQAEGLTELSPNFPTVRFCQPPPCCTGETGAPCAFIPICSVGAATLPALSFLNPS